MSVLYNYFKELDRYDVTLDIKLFNTEIKIEILFLKHVYFYILNNNKQQ